MTNATNQFDEIRADRACVGCGFNLYAQPVTKEEHYGLAICRCPECGTVAALQSYPAMTHWVNRFRMLIAAAWVAMLLAVFVVNIMTYMGMATGASNLASERMGDIIGAAHNEWTVEQAQNKALSSTTTPTTPAPAVPGVPAGTTIVTNNGITTINGVMVGTTTPAVATPGQYRWTWLTAGWAKEHLDQVVKDSGGLVAHLDRKSLLMLIPGTIVAALFGIFWSVALLGGSRRRGTIVPLIVCLVALLVHLGVSRPNYNFTSVGSIAQDLYAPVVGPVYMAYLFLMSVVGIWIGRKIARLVIVLAVPARGRVPFSLLWTCEGHTLPKSK